MESDFGRCISSALFTFVVGQGRKEIIVHSAPLAGLSITLDKLMNGEMLEAKVRQADWSQVVEEDTFVRLCEYAYLGDYTPPPCLEREASPSIPGPVAGPGEQDWGSWTSTPKTVSKSGKFKKKCRSRICNIEVDQAVEYPSEAPIAEPLAPESESVPEEETPYDPFEGHTLPYREKSIWSRHLKDRFKDLNMRYAGSYENTLSLRKTKFAPTGNSDPQQSFVPVFLGHARLYVLADKYNILSLADLVLQKLAVTLEHFTLCDNNIGDVVELVQFAYQHTRADDGIRTLVTRYIVSVLGQIGDSSTFRELLAEDGDFVYDFWDRIWH